TLEFGRRHAQMMVEWCDAVLAALAEQTLVREETLSQDGREAVQATRSPHDPSWSPSPGRAGARRRRVRQRTEDPLPWEEASMPPARWEILGRGVSATMAASSLKRLLELFIGFFRATILAYGGGPASIPLLEAEAVDHFRWLTREEFADALAAGNALPGPIVTKMAAYVGYHVAGWPGAVVAMLTSILPTALVMIALVGLLQRFGNSPILEGMLRGVRPVVWVLFISLAVDYVSFVQSVPALLIAAAAFVGLYVLQLHPAILVAGALAVGAVFLREDSPGRDDGGRMLLAAEGSPWRRGVAPGGPFPGGRPVLTHLPLAAQHLQPLHQRVIPFVAGSGRLQVAEELMDESRSGQGLARGCGRLQGEAQVLLLEPDHEAGGKVPPKHPGPVVAQGPGAGGPLGDHLQDRLQVEAHLPGIGQPFGHGQHRQGHHDL